MTKPTKWLCAQSDQSSLCTQWVAKDPSFLHADSEDRSDWAHSHFVGFVMSQLIFIYVWSFFSNDRACR